MLSLIIFGALVAGSFASPVERIINGTDAKWGEIPYIVSLRWNNQHVCGGSILDETHVLTAAHCVYNISQTIVSIQYGLLEITSQLINTIGVRHIECHPEYRNDSSYRHDIAVITLNGRIKFSNNVWPTILPQPYAPTPAKQWAVLAGWGDNVTNGTLMDHLQRVDIMCYSDQYCEWSAGVDSNIHICGGVHEGGKGMCNGDSGGPFNVYGTQVGIVSYRWSELCEQKGFPSVYTKVSSYVYWIRSKMN